VSIYTSILFPCIAPPLSSTVYVIPFITTCVPNANVFGAAIVLLAVAWVPDAVIPSVFPQQITQGQYAVTLYTPDCPDVPDVLDTEPLDVTVFVCTWTIFVTGSFIIFEDSSIFSISILFLYLILYVTSLNPFWPYCIIVFVVKVLPFEASFVIVSNGICSLTVSIFSVIFV